MAEKDRNNRPRNFEIRVKVTENELKFAKDKAKYLNMTMSNMIRSFIKDGVIVKYEPFDIKELSNEINKVGVNINQIAKCVNEKGGNYDKEDIENLKIEFQNLSDLIFNKVYGI